MGPKLRANMASIAISGKLAKVSRQRARSQKKTRYCGSLNILTKQVGVASSCHKYQSFWVIDIIDQEPVWPDMTFPHPLPLSDKFMGPAPLGKLLIGGKKIDNFLQLYRRDAALFMRFKSFLKPPVG